MSRISKQQHSGQRVEVFYELLRQRKYRTRINAAHFAEPVFTGSRNLLAERLGVERLARARGGFALRPDNGRYIWLAGRQQRKWPIEQKSLERHTPMRELGFYQRRERVLARRLNVEFRPDNFAHLRAR